MAAVRRVLDRLRADALLRHSVLLMAAAQVGNGANFLFQFLMMRGLPPAEYAALSAMLGILLVLALPLEAVRTAVAHGIAEARSLGVGTRVVSRWVGRWVFGTSMAGILVVAVFTACGPGWTVAFDLPRQNLAVFTGVLLAGSLVIPVMVGALQGMEWFGRMAAVSQAWAVLRLLLGAALVGWISATASSALLAHAAGLAVSLALGAALLARGLRAPGRCEGRVSGRVGYLLFALPALVGFGLLMNVDVVLVKLRFAPDEAGLFARAATLARAVAFLPMPVALAVFPKLARDAASEGTRRTARRALGLVLFLSLAGSAAGLGLASPFWRLFTGASPGPRALALTRGLMLGMAPFGLIFTQVHVLLARRRFRAASAAFILALLYVAAALVVPTTVEALVPILAAASTAAAVWLGLLLYAERPRPAAAVE